MAACLSSLVIASKQQTVAGLEGAKAGSAAPWATYRRRHRIPDK